MPPETVHFLMESHYDLLKVSRYFAFFKHFNPDHVTIELDEKRLEARKKCMGDTLRTNLGDVETAKKEMHRDNLKAMYSFFLGAYYAAQQYKQKVNPNTQIHLIDPVGYDVQKKIIPRDPLEIIQSSDPITMLLLKACLKQKLAAITIFQDCGVEDVLDRIVIVDILLSDNTLIQEIATMIDATYFLYLKPNAEAVEFYDLDNRDSKMRDVIKGLDGVVAHCGGMAHFCRNKSLYELVKRDNINADRFRLIRAEELRNTNAQTYFEKVQKIAQDILKESAQRERNFGI